MTAPAPPGLGRRFAGHDERSRAYGIVAALDAGIGPPRVQRRNTWWPLPAQQVRMRFPLDQGQEGECTGYGLAHNLLAGPVYVPGIDQAYARQRFARARAFDLAAGRQFDEGASMLALMRSARADRLLTGYRWAFGVDDVIDAVCSVGPVLLGIPWHQGMYRTRPGGLVEATGPEVGGHCLVVLGFERHRTFGWCLLWLNSWGRGYGVAHAGLRARGGVGYVPVDTLGGLLARDGEAVQPAEFLAPVPAAPRSAPSVPFWRRWQWAVQRRLHE